MDYLKYKDYLAHSRGDWKVHKYIRKSNGKYFYGRQHGEATASGGVHKRDLDFDKLLQRKGGSGTEEDPYVIIGEDIQSYENFLNDPKVQDMINIYCSKQPNSMALRQEMDRTGKYRLERQVFPGFNYYEIYELDLNKASSRVKTQARKKLISNAAKEAGVSLMRPTYKPKKKLPKAKNRRDDREA